MPVEVAIVVADSPPLIVLAATRCLDYLLYPGLPVIVPDAVFHGVFHGATPAAGILAGRANLARVSWGAAG